MKPEKLNDFSLLRKMNLKLEKEENVVIPLYEITRYYLRFKRISKNQYYGVTLVCEYIYNNETRTFPTFAHFTEGYDDDETAQKTKEFCAPYSAPKGHYFTKNLSENEFYALMPKIGQCKFNAELLDAQINYAIEHNIIN